MTLKLDMKWRSKKKDGWYFHSIEFENDKEVITVISRVKLANVQTDRGKKKIRNWIS